VLNSIQIRLKKIVSWHQGIHSIGDSRSDNTITIATTARVAGAGAVADAVASLSATANTATTAITTEGDGRSSMHSISKSPTTNVTTTAAITRKMGVNC